VAPISVSRAFEAQAARTPDRVAVQSEEAQITYAALNRRANELARAIGRRVEARGRNVGVLLPRGIDAVAALLGVMKAGAAYVPIDADAPDSRRAAMMAAADLAAVVTNRELSLRAGANGWPILLVDSLDIDEPAEAEDHADGPGAADTAYVIFTSGSTGAPKGVAVAHAACLNLLAGLQRDVYRDAMDQPLRATLNAPLSFDASVQQLVLLLDGHTLSIVPQDVRTDGPAFVRFLTHQAIDALDCTPTSLRMLVEAGLLEQPDPPRLVLAAGEAIDGEFWRRLAAAPRSRIYNI
jgi:non-ribosomal peptide synthetase component F